MATAQPRQNNRISPRKDVEMNNRGYLNRQAALSNILLKKEILHRWSITEIPTTSSGEIEFSPGRFVNSMLGTYLVTAKK